MNVLQKDLGASTRPRVLLATNSAANLASVPEYLDEQGCLIVRCGLASDLGREVGRLMPDLVIVAENALLDLLDLCQVVRTTTAAPLLVLGQRDAEADEVLCLESGADSYLTVASSPRRIRAHLTAILRRARSDERSEADQALHFGDVRIDLARRRVHRGDQELELSQKEYALLIFLVEHAGRAVTRQALAEFVWGSSTPGESRSLDVHIHWLREKLEVDASNPRHIRTVRGVGYCFDL